MKHKQIEKKDIFVFDARPKKLNYLLAEAVQLIYLHTKNVLYVVMYCNRYACKNVAIENDFSKMSFEMEKPGTENGIEEEEIGDL